MKKWYVITGILVLLWIISLGTCSSSSAQVDRLKGDLRGLGAELSSAKTQLTKSEAELDGVKAELAQLKATKEISFGNGLKVFGLSLPTRDWSWSSGVSGKVQNTSNLPMELVYVIVTAYDKDGTLKEMSSLRVFDLYPNEVEEWAAYSGLNAAIYGVYAFGNR